MRMFFRLLLCVIFACSLGACATQSKKKKAQNAELAKEQKKLEDMEDAGQDVDFLAFVSRLKQAVAQHDATTIAPMMTTNFGYRLNPDGEGEGVFQYWDQQNIWPILLQVLDKPCVPKGDFMVTPPEFAHNPDTFHGYRAGFTSYSGSWKFAYFVTD